MGGYNGIGNIDADPLFVNDFVFIPSPESPCISAGSLANSTSTDILGNPRPLPLNSMPDMGCYEVDQYFAHARVQFYYDVNENGLKDNDERYIALGAVSVEGDRIYNNFRPEGIFVIVPQGPLSLAYDESANQGWHATGQNSFEFNVDSDEFAAQVEIGLFPDEFDSNLTSHLVSDRFRCGEEVDFVLTVVNYGTTIEGV